jgi:large subunit ribosomal protein L6
MSRLGKKPVNIPGNVKVAVDKGIVAVEGPKGKLEYNIPLPIKVEVKGSEVRVSRPSDLKEHMSLHGLVRTLISNMIMGVTEGYKKELEIKGVGYKAQAQGPKLTLSLGFSHPVEYQVPEGITAETPKPTIIIIKGIDKVKVGEVAAELRDFHKPEPYKGKGIRYKDEYVRHKAGKTVA